MGSRSDGEAWRRLLVVLALLFGASNVSLIIAEIPASAAKSSGVNIAAFCKAETTIARYDTNGYSLGTKLPTPMSWNSIKAETRELTTLDKAQAEAALTAPTKQLKTFSKEMSKQFGLWLSDPAVVKFEAGITKTLTTSSQSNVMVPVRTASYIMESQLFIKPVEHYCPQLRPTTTYSASPKLSNTPAYFSTPIDVEAFDYLTALASKDDEGKGEAIIDPSLTHLYQVAAEKIAPGLRATIEGTPENYGSPSKPFGQYYWNISYTLRVNGHKFSAQVHLERTNNADNNSLVIHDEKVISLKPTTHG